MRYMAWVHCRSERCHWCLDVVVHGWGLAVQGIQVLEQGENLEWRHQTLNEVCLIVCLLKLGGKPGQDIEYIETHSGHW